jgi:hypothetical protein
MFCDDIYSINNYTSFGEEYFGNFSGFTLVFTGSDDDNILAMDFHKI